jgi:hypothetical protein
MLIRIRVIAVALLLLPIYFVSSPPANAGCQDYPESITPQCVAENLAIAKLAQEAYEAAQIARRLQEEQTARDNAAKDAADRAATIAADNALAPDDCARSTNRGTQRCGEIEAERARIENEAIGSIRKISELEVLQKLAIDKYAANKCDQAANKLLQVCIDSVAGANAVKKEATSLAKKVSETQSLLTKPLVDANGEVILTALLKSKSLGAKDIKAVLDASSLSTSEKKLLSTYAQTLNNLKSTKSLRNFKIPFSQSLSEDFSSSTPKICTVVDGLVKTLKPGPCVLSIKFTTESGFEVQTTKKIALKK